MSTSRPVVAIGIWVGLGLALLLFPSIALSSQIVRVEQRVEVDLLVPAIQSLEIDRAFLTAPVLQARDFDLGYFQFPDPLWITISSNSPWELAVRRPPGDATPSRLHALQLQDGARVLNISGPWQTLIRGDETKKTRFPFQIRVPLHWEATTPGSYEPQLEYRLGPDRIYP